MTIKKFVYKYRYLISITLVILAIGFIIWNQQNQIEKITSLDNSSVLVEKKADSIINKVNKIYLLPQNEKPIIFSISQTTDLSKEPVFYKNAKVGDIVLIYNNTHKGIIFRASVNKIINASDVTLETQIN